MADDGGCPKASSSKRTLDSSGMASGDPGGRPRGNTMSTWNSAATTIAPSHAESSGTAKRKVRTVPPSAAFEPPTPPNDSQPTFDTARREVERPPHRRRRRLRQYWSSGESSCSSDADDSSDAEPPWWTFTHKGMARLRAGLDRPARSTPARNDYADAAGTENESGRDSVRDKDRRRRSVMNFKTPSRQNSNETTPPASRRASATARLFHPRPFSSTTHALLRRSSDHDGIATAHGPIVERTNSAPNDHLPMTRTPENAAGEPTTARQRSPEPLAGDVTDPGPPGHRRLNPRRLMTMPAVYRRRDANEPLDALTDSEATMHASPRIRAKQRLFNLGALSNPVPEEEGHQSDPNGSPETKNRRLNANNLRIRLPPPLTHHFSQGWPHAGSWQDALRTGELDDGVARRRPASHDMTIALPPPPDAEELTAVARESLDQTSRQRGIDFSDVASPERVKRKSKGNRTRRYRPAMAPPTPGGLTLTPGQGERVIGSETWGTNAAPAPDPNDNPFDRLNPFDRIDEEYALSPQQSRLSEKASTLGKGRWGRHRKARSQDSIARRKRWRRILFLDARVTIYIRFFNLATSVTLLALAISIRLKEGGLGLRGIIGPSTTLIISYACFTIVHGLTAMYREYFGRPIGLWALRSKMLWVCLDLLFIALWASAATLAINDYINTPLDCTPGSPWWTSGKDFYSRKAPGMNKIAEWRGPPTNTLGTDTYVDEAVKYSSPARAVCRRQIGCFAVSIVSLLLYCGNMVLSLFRIFETVRRTANTRPVSV